MIPKAAPSSTQVEYLASSAAASGERGRGNPPRAAALERLEQRPERHGDRGHGRHVRHQQRHLHEQAGDREEQQRAARAGPRAPEQSADARRGERRQREEAGREDLLRQAVLAAEAKDRAVEKRRERQVGPGRHARRPNRGKRRTARTARGVWPGRSSARRRSPPPARRPARRRRRTRRATAAGRRHRSGSARRDSSSAAPTTARCSTQSPTRSRPSRTQAHEVRLLSSRCRSAASRGKSRPPRRAAGAADRGPQFRGGLPGELTHDRGSLSHEDQTPQRPDSAAATAR